MWIRVSHLFSHELEKCSQTHQKWTKHDPKMLPKWAQNWPQTVPNRLQNRGRDRLHIIQADIAKSLTAAPQKKCVFGPVLGAVWETFGCRFFNKFANTFKNGFWNDFEPISSSKLAPIWVPNWLQDCEQVLMMLKNKKLQTHRYFPLFFQFFGCNMQGTTAQI